MQTAPAGRGSWSAWLSLARISNLPTVWSNCLAAWFLAGGGGWSSLGWVLVGGSALYTGGMFLNDACDSSYDAVYRTERPIPLHRVSREAVFVCATALLCTGWFCFLLAGAGSSAWAAGLVMAIVLYDVLHKRIPAAPLLMALCRFLLYCSAAAASVSKEPGAALWPAAGLAAYVAGLSYLARGESKASERQPYWALGLLFAPMLVKGVHLQAFAGSSAIPMLIFAGWLAWTLMRAFTRPVQLARAVPGLLAGIVLVDWMLVPNGCPLYSPMFATLFVLSLVLQRFVAST